VRSDASKAPLPGEGVVKAQIGIEIGIAIEIPIAIPIPIPIPISSDPDSAKAGWV